MQEHTAKTKEQILGLPFYPHECGSMIDCVTKQDALKAMDEFAKQEARTEAIAFCDWWDEMMLKKHQLRRLKDEPKWFWNNRPNAPEGNQSWVSISTEELFQIFLESKKEQPLN